MKLVNFFSRTGCRLVAFLLGLGLVTGVGLIHAAPVIIDVAPNQPVFADWNDAVDDDTGVLVEKLSGGGGRLTIELLDEPGFTLPTPDGFLLLDNTLFVKPELEAGGRRMRIRIDYQRFGGRAGLRDFGIRANTIRILRADRNDGRWIRAVNGIRATNADIRYLRARRADFTLGHHGFDEQKEFAWAVVDTQGAQYYALGGLANVPLPAAWLLFITGSGLLLMVSRKTARSGS